MTPSTPSQRSLPWWLALAVLLALSGCSSMSTLRSFLGGRVVVTEAELQQHLDRRFPREFDAAAGVAALTLEQPQARLHGDTLSLAFDLRASVAGLRLPLRGWTPGCASTRKASRCTCTSRA